MDVEIVSVKIVNGIVFIFCNDISDENLRRMERMRDDAAEREVIFRFDSHIPKEFQFLYGWLKNQKATQGVQTWGQALNSTIGTITVIPYRFRCTSW